MDLGLTERQQSLQSEARSVLERECPIELVRAVERDGTGCPAELWETACQQGWPGVAVPERYGGTGGDFVDLTVLLEEMGRALFPGPLFSTVVLGALPILAFGSERQKEHYLPRISSGELVFSAALSEPWHRGSSIDPTAQARPADSGHSLTGEKMFVPSVEAADLFLVPATVGGADGATGVFILPSHASGVGVTEVRGLAPEHHGQLKLEGVQLGPDDILGAAGNGRLIVEQIGRWAAVALCAQMWGAAQRLLEMTVEYAKERVQFGRPIGSFQAVQHHCANMAIDADSMRYMAHLAAWKLSREESADLEVSMAKAWCSSAGDRVAELAHQVHAAIAFTEEHPLSLFSRRLKVWSLVYGGPSEHEEAVARHLGLEGG